MIVGRYRFLTHQTHTSEQNREREKTSQHKCERWEMCVRDEIDKGEANGQVECRITTNFNFTHSSSRIYASGGCHEIHKRVL